MGNSIGSRFIHSRQKRSSNAVYTKRAGERSQEFVAVESTPGAGADLAARKRRAPILSAARRRACRSEISRFQNQKELSRRPRSRQKARPSSLLLLHSPNSADHWRSGVVGPCTADRRVGVAALAIVHLRLINARMALGVAFKRGWSWLDIYIGASSGVQFHYGPLDCSLLNSGGSCRPARHSAFPPCTGVSYEEPSTYLGGTCTHWLTTAW